MSEEIQNNIVGAVIGDSVDSVVEGGSVQTVDADSQPIAEAAVVPVAPAASVDAKDVVPVLPVDPVVPEVQETLLAVDVSFDDTQLSLILGAGLEPAQVRNEIGLVWEGREEPQVVGSKFLTLTEAINRASKRYLSV